MTQLDKDTQSGLDRPGAGLAVSQKRRWDWRVLVLELVIVFVGLFAALQLESWREDRAFHEDQHRLLERFRDELETYLLTTQHLEVFLAASLQAVEHVHASLTAGEILDDDAVLFEFGLVYFEVLPLNPLPRSTYDEMVASGMFTALNSHELSREISVLMNWDAFVAENFRWWRRSATDLMDSLIQQVEFYDDPVFVRPAALQDTVAFLDDEPQRRVRYDFDALAADRGVVNGFYWVKDTISDWLAWTRRLRGHARHAIELIDQELGR